MNKESLWVKFQIWLLQRLPYLRNRVENLENAVTSLEDTLKTYEGLEARHIKRLDSQEKKHKKQMKDLRAELVSLIDGTHPSPEITWIEMGMKRAILRDTFGNGGPATIYTASRMAERIREGSMELDYLPTHERAQVKDLLTSEFGKSLLEEAAAEYLRQAADCIQVDKMMSYNDITTTYRVYPKRDFHIGLAVRENLFDYP